MEPTTNLPSLPSDYQKQILSLQIALFTSQADNARAVQELMKYKIAEVQMKLKSLETANGN